MKAPQPAFTLSELLVTPRSATFEISNGSPYRSKQDHAVFLDGQHVWSGVENVFTVPIVGDARLEHVLEVRSDGRHLTYRFRPRSEVTRISIADRGAKSDGLTDNTATIQAAIADCPEGGVVVFPQGDWLTGPIFLKSGVDLYFARGARIVGHPDIDAWPVLPALVRDEAGVEQVLGTWEGEPADCHAGLITGVGVTNVSIYGPGVIDGNATFQTWWSRPKARFTGWRPRLVYLVRARQIAMEGLTLRNAPSWTAHPFQSRDLTFARLSIEAPADSPNTDGINPESCENVRISGVRFATGDDCIAIKSGKIAMAKYGALPSRGIHISNCLMEAGHGGVVIGSEMSGGVYDVDVRDCLFLRTDRGLRLKTRRGRGKTAIIDGVHLENVEMEGVGTPFVINSFYWCDPDGKQDWIGDRNLRPVDDGTPTIRNISLANVRCRGVRHSAGFVLGLPERPVEDLFIRDYSVRYASEAEPGEPDMAAGIVPVVREGFRLTNIHGLAMTNVDIEGAAGPAIIEENVT